MTPEIQTIAQREQEVITQRCSRDCKKIAQKLSGILRRRRDYVACLYLKHLPSILLDNEISRLSVAHNPRILLASPLPPHRPVVVDIHVLAPFHDVLAHGAFAFHADLLEDAAGGGILSEVEGEDAVQLKCVEDVIDDRFRGL